MGVSIATIGFPQCDGEGSVYYHLAMPAPADPRSGPVVRISADGKRVVKISLDSIPDLPQGTQIEAIAPGLRGELHILASAADGFRLINFDDEGKFKSLTEVEARFAIRHVAVFPSGQFLGAGEKIPEKHGDASGEPFTAIFDRNGKLISELNFVGDVSPKVGAQAGDQRKAISLGEAVPADDGNIYLSRAAERPLILVISPGGELVRRLRLDPPDRDRRAGTMKVAGGKIVISFFKPNNDKQNSGTNLYTLYDAETGERQLDFEPSAETNGIFACYAPNQFTFLDVTDNGLSIVHAVPR